MISVMMSITNEYPSHDNDHKWVLQSQRCSQMSSSNAMMIANKQANQWQCKTHNHMIAQLWQTIAQLIAITIVISHCMFDHESKQSATIEVRKLARSQQSSRRSFKMMFARANNYDDVCESKQFHWCLQEQTIAMIASKEACTIKTIDWWNQLWWCLQRQMIELINGDEDHPRKKRSNNHWLVIVAVFLFVVVQGYLHFTIYKKVCQV